MMPAEQMPEELTFIMEEIHLTQLPMSQLTEKRQETSSAIQFHQPVM
ncbi:MAG: hypothetical protein IPL16_06195 [Ignavibacteria bacterium]|nr:hypothetical protein [Ignavibacteria bacterium]